MSDNIHTCSYQCDRPACIKAQRDELVKLNEQLQARVAELEVDANRYRWLKESNDDKQSTYIRDLSSKHYGLEWDKIIDAAILAERGELT